MIGRSRLLLLLATVVERALGGCPYERLTLPIVNASILVADATCKTTKVCGIRRDCVEYSTFSMSDNSYVRFYAVGDMNDYTQPNLYSSTF